MSRRAHLRIAGQPSDEPGVEFGILGPLEVVRRGHRLAIAAGKQRALLAVLLLHVNEVVSRDRLVDCLWDGRPPATAAKSVQVYVSQLRKALASEAADGRGVLLTRGSGYMVRLEPDALDVYRFERELTRGRHALGAGQPQIAAAALRSALALWRGPPLADFAYEPFAQTEIARLEDSRLAALEERIEADLQLGRHADVVGELQGLVAAHPLRERLWAQLMLALYRCGRQGEALGAYQQARTVLVEELGLEPGSDLRRLEAALLAQDPDVDWRPPPEAGRPGAARPGAAEDLPLLERSAATSDLPVPATSIVGRDRELAALAEALEQHRLVTLTGTGGVGKTRLALEAAGAAAARSAAGVFFVELAALTDPGLVINAIAEALAVREIGEISLRRSLKQQLREAQLLLVLDNFEHLVSAAADVSELLAAAPGLSVLVTSRCALRVSGEHEFAVQPLALPDLTRAVQPEPLSRCVSVELFVARARARKPGFELTERTAPAVAEICVRLEGLPLAIELAAARVKLLSPEAMRDRLGDPLRFLTGGMRDLPARQRTLRATIEWSYRLAAESERRLLRCLSVFAGDWSLESAEVVCGCTGDLGDVLDGVSSLVDQSLLRSREAPGGDLRFAMLEVIREFAAAELQASGDVETVRAAHAGHILAIAERGDAVGAGVDGWLARIDAELANVRAALSWAAGAGEAEILLRLAGALETFWAVRGPLTEGREWLRMALAADRGALVSSTARALMAAARLAYEQGDIQAAAQQCDQAIALYRELGDVRELGRATARRGIAALLLGEYERGIALEQEGIELLDRAGDSREAARFALNIGYVALMRGEFERAAVLCEDGLARVRRLDDKLVLLGALQNLGFAELEQGAALRALAHLEEGVRAASELGFTQGAAVSLLGFAALASRWGRPALAAQALAAVDASLGSDAVKLDPYERGLYDRTAAALIRQPAARESAREAAGRDIPLDEMTALAQAIAEDVRPALEE